MPRHASSRLIAAVGPASPREAPRAMHAGPTRAQRHELLVAAIRRKRLHEAQERPLDHPERHSSVLADLRATQISSASSSSSSSLPMPSSAEARVTAFVESSGWSSGSLEGVLQGDVEPGMSRRTQNIVAETSEDLRDMGALFGDMSHSFLEATSQVKTHLRAGVSARQLIAMVCNKMVLRDMPPKVGLGIVKALAQPVLNILEETVSDQLTQYFVPPGSIGAFVQTGEQFRPLGKEDVAAQAAELVASVDPRAAGEIVKAERASLQAEKSRRNQLEKKRREKMELLEFLEIDETLTAGADGSTPNPAAAAVVAAASKEGVSDSPAGAVTGANAPDPALSSNTTGSSNSTSSSSSEDSEEEEDPYLSFLSTYSASAERQASKGGTSVGKSGTSIGEKVKQHFTFILTNSIIHDSSAQLEHFLTTLLHESLSKALHSEIQEAVTESLTESLTTSITESQVALQSVMLRCYLTRGITMALSKSLTLLLTPALSLVLTRSLTRSPHSDYYCALCENPVEMEKPAEFHLDPPFGADTEKPYCLSCSESKEHDYYLDYYSAYYAKYYSSYYAYYADFYAKRWHEHVMSTQKLEGCPKALPE